MFLYMFKAGVGEEILLVIKIYLTVLMERYNL